MHKLALLLLASAASFAANKDDRIEWFRDQGFGMFIHWSHDSQVGSVISHSMVGSSEGYLRKFINDLPKTFDPYKFRPRDWAVLARLAGMRYVVFTAKHHSGFCMFHTATTGFSIKNTPFQRDITGELLKAFKEQGVAPGLYFSPDDFWWLYKNGKTIQRGIPEVQPKANPGLMKHDQAQVRELLTQYGPVDVIFFDGEAEGLKDLAWQIQPNIVVTRGEIETPEQYIPGVPLKGPWEGNMTMGTQWQYKPTNDLYKGGWQLISNLIETRAKGGNFLLNVGPKPDGELPIEQEERLREVALWMMVNSEMIYGVRPWIITNEQDYWFTKAKNEETLYVAVKLEPKNRWPHGEWKDIVLHSVRASANTKVSVLSQNDKVVEYRAGVVPATTFEQKPGGLHIRANRAQRLYNDRKWPNPVVLKLTNVKPALQPPVIETISGSWDASTATATLQGNLRSLGDSSSLQAGFEYRKITGQDVNERTEPWLPAGMLARNTTGNYSLRTKALQRGEVYEIRAVVKHPLITLYGGEKRVTAR
ncbi:MAG: alpha-L-fucosidase [Acidobacteria bacterium]|nr:alpha-L-fucosidase [Acidobacteriota bacterium]